MFLCCVFGEFSKVKMKMEKCFLNSSTMKSEHNFLHGFSLAFMKFPFWFPIYQMFLFVKIELKSSVFVPFCFFIWMFSLIWNELWWLLFGFWFSILDKPPQVTIINIQGEIKNWIQKNDENKGCYEKWNIFLHFQKLPTV